MIVGMDQRTAQFIDVFQTFLDEVVGAHRDRQSSDATTLTAVLRAHLGVDPGRLPVASEDVAAYRFVDLDAPVAVLQRTADPQSGSPAARIEVLTVILLAGQSIRYVSEAAQMARALQPALVVLEDCDLVAESRDRHPDAQPLLFEVLDTLDGLADDADVAFLLTTNRADVLEPALAQRPGRVDLAVEVPLPDEPARRLLITRYARRLSFSEAALGEAAARSAGTTASFAKELVRRSVLIAAEAGREPGDADLGQALTEMLSEAQGVTRSLFGVPDRV